MCEDVAAIRPVQPLEVRVHWMHCLIYPLLLGLGHLFVYWLLCVYWTGQKGPKIYIFLFVIQIPDDSKLQKG